MHASNTSSLQLSLSCSQLCFRASINFQAVRVAMNTKLNPIQFEHVNFAIGCGPECGTK